MMPVMPSNNHEVASQTSVSQSAPVSVQPNRMSYDHCCKEAFRKGFAEAKGKGKGSAYDKGFEEGRAQARDSFETELAALHSEITHLKSTLAQVPQSVFQGNPFPRVPSGQTPVVPTGSDLDRTLHTILDVQGEEPGTAAGSTVDGLGEDSSPTPHTPSVALSWLDSSTTDLPQSRETLSPIEPPPTDFQMKDSTSLTVSERRALRRAAEDYQPDKYGFFVCVGTPEDEDSVHFEPLHEVAVDEIVSECIRPIAYQENAPIIISVQIDDREYVYNLHRMTETDLATGVCRPIMLVDLWYINRDRHDPDLHYVASYAECEITHIRSCVLRQRFIRWHQEGYFIPPVITRADTDVPLPSAEPEREPVTPAVPAGSSVLPDATMLVSSLPRQTIYRLRDAVDRYDTERYKFFVLIGRGKSKHFVRLMDHVVLQIIDNLFIPFSRPSDVPYRLSIELNRTSYVYDFSLMEQINTKTGRMRPIMLIDREENEDHFRIRSADVGGDRNCTKLHDCTTCIISKLTAWKLKKDFR